MSVVLKCLFMGVVAVKKSFLKIFFDVNNRQSIGVEVLRKKVTYFLLLKFGGNNKIPIFAAL